MEGLVARGRAGAGSVQLERVDAYADNHVGTLDDRGNDHDDRAAADLELDYLDHLHDDNGGDHAADDGRGDDGLSADHRSAHPRGVVAALTAYYDTLKTCLGDPPNCTPTMFQNVSAGDQFQTAILTARKALAGYRRYTYPLPDDLYFNIDDVSFPAKDSAVVTHCVWSNANVFDTMGTSDPGDDATLVRPLVPFTIGPSSQLPTGVGCLPRQVQSVSRRRE